MSTPPSHDKIYRDMTGAFSAHVERDLTPRAEKGLRDFIREGVIEGVDRVPGSYEVYREYLKCRFKHIAWLVNGSVAHGRKVRWRELIDIGQAEVLLDRLDCSSLFHGEDPGTLRRICAEYDPCDVVEDTTLDDTP